MLCMCVLVCVSVCVCYEQVYCVNFELGLQLWSIIESLCASESKLKCITGCYRVNAFVSRVKADLSLHRV